MLLKCRGFLCFSGIFFFPSKNFYTIVLVNFIDFAIVILFSLTFCLHSSQRQNSRIWSRTSSPRSTPSSTPPSTPRVNSGWTPFSQFALYATLRKQRSLKQLMETRVNESSSSFLTKSYENLSLQIEATA